MNKPPAAFPNPLMPTIVADTGAERPKTDTKMTYLNKKNIYEYICQKLRKIYEYETDMHKIYNLFVIQTNEQPQEKAASADTYQSVES